MANENTPKTTTFTGRTRKVRNSGKATKRYSATYSLFGKEVKTVGYSDEGKGLEWLHGWLTRTLENAGVDVSNIKFSWSEVATRR